jgi:4-diphosphocytidyl-2-C-methyl-D-erythritol kinase
LRGARETKRSLSKVNRPALQLPSFAKINWQLRILGKRPDGYHEISTVLQTISLHDQLTFEVTSDPKIVISCNDADVPTDNQNLIVRAANALKSRFRIEGGARVTLEKSIPMRAGLGGGSSNAAIALVALNYLWDIKASPTDLLDMAPKLGADVPFFLWGGRALATGTGATISPLQDPAGEAVPLLVIAPNASISTAFAYASLGAAALTTSVGDPILSSSREAGNFRDSQPWPPADSLQNDFESVIFDIEPEIKRAKEILLQAGARAALLAGSGSSVFGIFADRDDQQRALNEIKLEAGWRIFPCVTVSRIEYQGAVASPDIQFLRSFNSGSDIGA